MTWLEAETALKAFFITNIPIAINFSNEPFTKPDPSIPWCEITIQELRSRPVSIGTKGFLRYRRLGMAQINFYTPQNTGSFDSMQLIENFRAQLEGVAIEGITTTEFSHNVVGFTGAWFQTNVTVAFNFYSAV